MIKKPRKFAVSALCIFIVASVLFSLAFIALESHHDCSGEHCHICELIISLDTALRKISSSFSLLAFVMGALAVFLASAAAASLCEHAPTPVVMKVRLNR